MAVTQRSRYEVFRRDNHTCRYCGAAAPSVELTIDHVNPISLGGSDDPNNLVTACRPCNTGKGSSAPGGPLVQDVKEIDLRWAAAMKKAAEVMAVKDEPRWAYIAAFFETWPQYRRLPVDTETSVGRLFDAGLPESVMCEAALIAATNRGIYDRFAYFMGMCWKRVDEQQTIAKQILESEL